jgi:hypothetical protein
MNRKMLTVATTIVVFAFKYQKREMKRVHDAAFDNGWESCKKYYNIKDNDEDES